MAFIKGQNLRILYNGKVIASATSAQFHVAVQTENSSTKDDTGSWASNEVVGLSWDASTDCLVSLTDPTGGSDGNLPQDLFTAMVTGTPLTLVFDVASGTNNRTAQNSGIKKTGQALISDWSCTAANRQNSTLTVQFTGTGALS